MADDTSKIKSDGDMSVGVEISELSDFYKLNEQEMNANGIVVSFSEEGNFVEGIKLIVDVSCVEGDGTLYLQKRSRTDKGLSNETELVDNDGYVYIEPNSVNEFYTIYLKRNTESNNDETKDTFPKVVIDSDYSTGKCGVSMETLKIVIWISIAIVITEISVVVVYVLNSRNKRKKIIEKRNREE